MRKLSLILFSLILLNGVSFAKDSLNFDFPNEGWHKVMSPDGIESKKCYVPYNQTSENYTEMLTFIQRKTGTTGITPMAILNKQLGKDRLNYKDIIPEVVLQESNNAMITWCSAQNNTCAVERAFNGNDGVILAIYKNKMPHYSQNMFGQWTNILGRIKVHTPDDDTSNNVIEL